MTTEELAEYFYHRHQLPPTYEAWANPTQWPESLDLHPAVQVVDLRKYIALNLDRMLFSESLRVQQLAQGALAELHSILTT